MPTYDDAGDYAGLPKLEISGVDAAPAAPRPSLVYRLPASMFPLLIEALHYQTRAVVWSRRVERPIGSLRELHIPPLARQLGHPVLMRVTFADGTVMEKDPDRGLPAVRHGCDGGGSNI